MNDRSQEWALVQTAMEALPPILRDELVNDEIFVQRWSIPIETSLSLSRNGPVVSRTELYQAIRTAIRSVGTEVAFVDNDQSTWTVVCRSRNGGLSFMIKSAGREVAIADHSALADDREIREAWLEGAACDVSVEGGVVEKWRNRVACGPLDDQEFSELISDFAITPTSVYQNIVRTLASGRVSVQTLVPLDKRYYGRLTGTATFGSYVRDFIARDVAGLIEMLQERNAAQGFLLSLLVCSAGEISDNIRIDGLEKEEMLDVYRWLVENGDPISQVSAVEVGLSHISKYPELETCIERMSEQLICDNAESGNGRFELLSAIVTLVSSELIRTNTLGRVPPFYRRQVAIAQASLIVRAIINVGGDRESLIKWAGAVGREQTYFVQGLVDLRVEPRGLPSYTGPRQLRAGCLGRVLNAAARHGEQIQSESLRALLVGSDSRLRRVIEWPLAVLPGVLEGAVARNRTIPEGELRDVLSRLEEKTPKSEIFVDVGNAALIFDLPRKVASVTAASIIRMEYSIGDSLSEGELLSIAKGLAVLASISRDTELSSVLRVLVRVLRRKKRFVKHPQEELGIAMLAAASHRDRAEWACFVGEWITELAFEIDGKHGAGQSRAMLRELIRIEPMIARHCSAADAALASVLR